MSEPKPESVHAEFARCFEARDLDGLMALYADGASFVTEEGETLTGKAAIREALSGFLAAEGEMKLRTRYAIRAGDTALLSNEWHFSGTGADGETFEMGGRTAEVVRLQPDGRWLMVVDHPWGGQ